MAMSCCSNISRLLLRKECPEYDVQGVDHLQNRQFRRWTTGRDGQTTLAVRLNIHRKDHTKEPVKRMKTAVPRVGIMHPNVR